MKVELPIQQIEPPGHHYVCARDLKRNGCELGASISHHHSSFHTPFGSVGLLLLFPSARSLAQQVNLALPVLIRQNSVSNRKCTLHNDFMQEGLSAWRNYNMSMKIR